MKKLSQKNQKPSLPVLKKLVGLSIGGLTLLAVLAWNNTIQEVTNNFVKNYIDEGSNVISFLIYGLVLVILFAVTGKQLAGLLDNIEKERENKS